MEFENELQLTTLSTTTTTTTVSDLHKAWHIFALLLSTGRPARPSELSSICTLFPTSPDLIEFLCLIPNSPLHFTTNCFVTFSQIGFVATVKFIANANAFQCFGPQLELRGVRPISVKECVVHTYGRKRKSTASDVENSPEVKKIVIRRLCGEAYLPNGTLSCGMNQLIRRPLSLCCDLKGLYNMFRTSSLVDGSATPSISGVRSIEYECDSKEDKGETVDGANSVHIPICKSEFLSHSVFNSPKATAVENITYSIPQLKPLCTSSLGTTSANTAGDTVGTTNNNNNNNRPSDIPQVGLVGTTERKLNDDIISYIGVDKEMRNLLSEADASVHVFERMILKENSVEDNEEEPASYLVSNRNADCIDSNPAMLDKSPQDTPAENATNECTTAILPMDTAKTDMPLESHAMLTRTQSVRRKQMGKSSLNSKPSQREVLDNREPQISKELKNHAPASLLVDKEHLRRNAKSIPMKLNYNQNYDLDMSIKEKKENPKDNGENFICNSTKNPTEQKQLPNFESYIVEEEEGSGGYGTVYRARRKSDGVKFAIKYPHSNANKQHVHNELKMLERFGGKNFVIKYEGSFKNESADCLVLEHVEHDRPEVLKRDVRVSQLQWYGYCMFRALAGLHKQGIVHRDVKPGNFLFSRKVNKGYLIDFNLAMDLYQKYGTSDKTKLSTSTSFSNGPIPLAKSLPPIKQRKYSKHEECINTEAAKGVKSLIRSKNLKRKAEQEKVVADIAHRSIRKSQGADGSGITSTKDATSNKTPSGERLREPIPCQGRKELINLVQQALQGSNHGETNVPTSKRKRVAAPPGKVERRYVYMTPMPLHSSGITIGGAGLLKSKGDGKHKREGPCVGTKGFRAPEVLFRSLHQGTKLDIWSAGVTLLYFIIGRTPFAGDPDQNIKEIVKLRGSEDLWEVAKLHNRESSFPPDLFDLKSLSPVRLQDWIKGNTRKPDFLNVIPQSLMDLVDKCLTVNPRLRISAEEALRHEFFTPCHEALRKHRLHRQGLSQEVQSQGSTLSLPENSERCGVL